jgi:hypothetical protein
MEDPFVSPSFATVTEEAASQEDWRIGFASITERAASEADWTAGFVSLTEGTDSQVDLTAGIASMREGAASQEDWSAVVVADPVQKTELLPVWETKVHLDDGGWNTSLAKREC